MALLSLHDISLTFGGHPLFDRISLQVQPGDRLCLLGRNGAGKSTLLALIAGSVSADSGSLAREPGLRVAGLGQEVPAGLGGSLQDVWSHGGELQVDTILATRLADQLGLNPGADFASASGGMKRKALLVRALASESDIVLLDEPTNHLDLEAIEWLESWLLARVKTCIFVTHDRRFAENIANRVAEVDRGSLYAFQATYRQFLERREELYAAELVHRQLQDKKLAQEEAWIRQGIKARRTRDEGRVRALIALRETVAGRRTKQGTARLSMASAAPSGDLVAELAGAEFAWPGSAVPLIRNLDTLIMRGDRIGIVGPNGAGKTTLIRLILGDLAPTGGTVRRGTRQEVLYFDQLRAQLDPEKSVAWNLAGNDDAIVVNGVSRHVNAYLRDFLFEPDRARSPVGILSGGERNRLLLAKLFTKASNLLVLDEPTNDLDSETMDLLEDLLLDYPGTILLVSHDRHFLDNVVTSLLVLKGDGTVEDFVGTHSDWLRRRREDRAAQDAKPAATKPREDSRAAPDKDKPRKLSFKEARELEALPALLAGLEEELESLHAAMADPGFYKQDQGAITTALERQAALETQIAQGWERWTELESLA